MFCNSIDRITSKLVHWVRFSKSCCMPIKDRRSCCNHENLSKEDFGPVHRSLNTSLNQSLDVSIPIEHFEETDSKQKEEQILADIMLPEKTKVPLPSTGNNIKEKPKYISIKRRPGLNVWVIGLQQLIKWESAHWEAPFRHRPWHDLSVGEIPWFRHFVCASGRNVRLCDIYSFIYNLVDLKSIWIRWHPIKGWKRFW